MRIDNGSKREQLKLCLGGQGPCGMRLEGGSLNPICISKLHKRGRAQRNGLKSGDQILLINNVKCHGLDLHTVYELLEKKSNVFIDILRYHRERKETCLSSDYLDADDDIDLIEDLRDRYDYSSKKPVKKKSISEMHGASIQDKSRKINEVKYETRLDVKPRGANYVTLDLNLADKTNFQNQFKPQFQSFKTIISKTDSNDEDINQVNNERRFLQNKNISSEKKTSQLFSTSDKHTYHPTNPVPSVLNDILNNSKSQLISSSEKHTYHSINPLPRFLNDTSNLFTISDKPAYHQINPIPSFSNDVGKNFNNKFEHEVIIWSSKPSLKEFKNSKEAVNEIDGKLFNETKKFQPVKLFNQTREPTSNLGENLNNTNFPHRNKFQTQNNSLNKRIDSKTNLNKESVYPKFNAMNFSLNSTSDYNQYPKGTNFENTYEPRISKSIRTNNLETNIKPETIWKPSTSNKDEEINKEQKSNFSIKEEIRNLQNKVNVTTQSKKKINSFASQFAVPPTSSSNLLTPSPLPYPVKLFEGDPLSSHFLTRGVLTAGSSKPETVTNEKIIYGDSSFYKEISHKYPTLNEQISMARKVASLLTSTNLKTGRGQEMFQKKQEQADRWVVEFDPIKMISPYRICHDHFVPAQPAIEVSKVKAKRAEYAEHMRLLDEKSHHNVVPFDVCAQLAKELNEAKGRGGSMFAKRKAKSEQWIAAENESELDSRYGLEDSTGNSRGSGKYIFQKTLQSPIVSEKSKSLGNLNIGHNYPSASTVNKTNEHMNFEDKSYFHNGDKHASAKKKTRLKELIDLPRPAMTPWEAMAEYGNVNKAFEHLRQQELYENGLIDSVSETASTNIAEISNENCRNDFSKDFTNNSSNSLMESYEFNCRDGSRGIFPGNSKVNQKGFNDYFKEQNQMVKASSKIDKNESKNKSVSWKNGYDEENSNYSNTINKIHLNNNTEPSNLYNSSNEFHNMTSYTSFPVENHPNNPKREYFGNNPVIYEHDF